MRIFQATFACGAFCLAFIASLAQGQIAPPIVIQTDLQALRDIVARLPADGGVEAIFDYQHDGVGSSRKYIAYAFASRAVLSSDGAGGFQGMDTQGNGFQRHPMENSRVEDVKFADAPWLTLGCARLIPTLYLLHFTRDNVAIFDFTTLPDGTMSFRVQQGKLKEYLTAQDIRSGVDAFLSATFTLDRAGRVTSVQRKNDTFESTERYTYYESMTDLWYLPQSASIGKGTWYLLDANTIPESQTDSKFSKTSMTVKVAIVTAEMKQAEIERSGGFEAIAKQSIGQTMRSQDGKPAFAYIIGAVAIAIIGGVGVFLLVRKRRHAA